jgi:type III pantothenate kinase
MELSMILTIDVGNTNITCGVFDKEEIVVSFRMTTKFPRTSDEYGMIISSLLEKNNLSVDDIEDAIICSVVPNIMHSLQGALVKYFKIKPIIVETGIRTGIRIVTPNPQQIGADRIVDAVGAYEQYGGPVIVIDFGTATTYDYVDETGAFLGGITAPGIRISAKALWEDAAKLPEIEIKKPENILAKDTISSMQSGLVYGQIGQTEYIIKKVREEIGREDAKVVVTGGLGRIIASETTYVDVYDPNLTLKGIYSVYKKNRVIK